jgi:hypothetical protein
MGRPGILLIASIGDSLIGRGDSCARELHGRCSSYCSADIFRVWEAWAITRAQPEWLASPDEVLMPPRQVDERVGFSQVVLLKDEIQELCARLTKAGANHVSESASERCARVDNSFAGVQNS